MPVQSSITDCDTNPAVNSPQGGESAKGNIDNYLRNAFAFIRQVYNSPLASLGSTGATTVAGARAALGATATGAAVFIAADAAAARATLGVGIRSHLAGLTLSTAGSSTTMTIAAGEAADSTNSQVMALAAVIDKTTAAWAVGTAAGGLDTGSVGVNTWYHWYLIKRVDTGVVDALMSLNATVPTLPANYTLYRRIGSSFTNSAGQWVSFVQQGDYFQWLAPVADVSANNPGIAAVTRTLSVPTGVNVIADVGIVVANIGNVANVHALFTDLAINDTAPGSTNSDIPVSVNIAGGVSNAAVVKKIRTNTSGQIRSRLSFSDANVTLTLNTYGWTDGRGRNA